MYLADTIVSVVVRLWFSLSFSSLSFLALATIQSISVCVRVEQLDNREKEREREKRREGKSGKE